MIYFDFMMRYLAALFCIFTALSLPARAIELSGDDSLTVFLAGDAAATWQKPSGIKGSENGLLRIAFTYGITRRLTALVGVRGYRSLPVPFLETGALSWKGASGRLAGGFLTCRYGLNRYYKTYTSVNPLFEKPLIWDAYGFGCSASSHPGRFTVEAAALMNNRESGSVHGYSGITLGRFDAGVVAGFQTYSVDDQDNDLTIGLASSAGWKPFKIHGAIKYLHGFGYSATSKTRLTTGNRLDGFVETRITPSPDVTVDMLGIYRYFKKWYEHSEGFIGIDARWRFLPWSGIGGGIEWTQSDRITTLTPELRLFVAPADEPTQLSLGIRRSRTGRSSPLFQVTGNICVSL